MSAERTSGPTFPLPDYCEKDDRRPMDEIVALLLSSGFTEAGETRTEQVRIPTTRLPLYGKCGGERVAFGGRRRFQRGDQRATVGKRTVCFYRMVDGKPVINSNDMNAFGRVAKIHIDAKANEAYVADGYFNRRVAVIDMDSGKIKRYWGGSGLPPDDGQLPPYNPKEPPIKGFRTVKHSVPMLSIDNTYNEGDLREWHRRVLKGLGSQAGAGGLFEDGGPRLERPRRPFAVRLRRGSNRLLDVPRLRLVPLGEHVAVIVRHDGVIDVARPDFAAADDERELDPLRRHRVEPPLQLRALAAARQVAQVGFVGGGRNAWNRRHNSIVNFQLPRTQLPSAGLGVGSWSFWELTTIESASRASGCAARRPALPTRR